MKLNRTLIVVISGVLVLLTIVAAYFVVNKNAGEEVSYEAFSTNKNLEEPPIAYIDNKKIFAQDKTLYIYLGSGSGANTGEVASVTQSTQQTTVHIDANYCGVTRDNKSLWVAVDFPKQVDTYKPIKATINTACGKQPKNLKLELQ